MGGALDPAVARARSLVRLALADLEPGDPVVVAVSGGADSLALAAVVAFLAPREGWQAEALVVDHGLQAASGEVAERAARQCRDLGLTATVVRVDVHGPGGPEAAARRARYEALHAHVPDAVVLTAHTLDDQAETVILGLGRGSGSRSIAGMARRSGRLRRPLLGVRRAETLAICRAYGLAPWVDPHNVDPAFRRVRVRHELLPLMDEILGGGVAEALARTAAQVSRDNDYLDRCADAFGENLLVADLAGLHPAVRSRVLRTAALKAGAIPGELSAVHLDELDRLVTDYRGQVQVELPGKVAARREGNRLVVGG